MPYVTAEVGAEIFYKDWGAGGRPVLLSHGWRLNSDAREAAALSFAEHEHRGIVHYVGRHVTERVAKVILVSAVPPKMVRTADNPAGLPVETFDVIRAGEAHNRSQLHRDLADGPFFGNNRTGEILPGPGTRSGCRGSPRNPQCL